MSPLRRSRDIAWLLCDTVGSYGIAGVCPVIGRACCVEKRLAMLRLADASSRTNNQPATMATPMSEIHMIQSATVGFALLANPCPNPATELWLVASNANTSAP